MRRRLEVEKAERDIALNGGFATLRHWDEDGDRPLVNPYDSAVRPQTPRLIGPLPCSVLQLRCSARRHHTDQQSAFAAVRADRPCPMTCFADT